MPENDLPFDLLRGLADVGVSGPSPAQLHARVSSVIATEIRRDSRRSLRLTRPTVQARRRSGRVLLLIGVAIPGVVVAAALLLAHRSPTTGSPAGAHHSGLTALHRAFPILTRSPTSADALPRGRWSGGSEHLERKLGRLVLSRGQAKMWLIPTAGQDVCLVGIRGLTGGGCTTKASAELQGFFSAEVGARGATEVEGMLPRGASLQVADARGRMSTIQLNHAGAFAQRLAHPAPQALITTADGGLIPVQMHFHPRPHWAPRNSSPQSR